MFASIYRTISWEISIRLIWENTQSALREREARTGFESDKMQTEPWENVTTTQGVTSISGLRKKLWKCKKKQNMEDNWKRWDSIFKIASKVMTEIAESRSRNS